MDSREVRDLMEAYLDVYASYEEIDEATAMAKRGYDETELRKRAGGGEAADRATALASRETYGDPKKKEAREKLARSQRKDFRSTASSSPGLRGYGYKSNDPAVQAKQAARGAERKQLNMGDDFANWVDALLDEGYDLSDYTWDEVYEAYTELLEANSGNNLQVQDVGVLVVEESHQVWLLQELLLMLQILLKVKKEIFQDLVVSLKNQRLLRW